MKGHFKPYDSLGYDNRYTLNQIYTNFVPPNLMSQVEIAEYATEDGYKYFPMKWIGVVPSTESPIYMGNNGTTPNERIQWMHNNVPLQQAPNTQCIRRSLMGGAGSGASGVDCSTGEGATNPHGQSWNNRCNAGWCMPSTEFLARCCSAPHNNCATHASATVTDLGAQGCQVTADSPMDSRIPTSIWRYTYDHKKMPSSVFRDHQALLALSNQTFAKHLDKLHPGKQYDLCNLVDFREQMAWGPYSPEGMQPHVTSNNRAELVKLTADQNAATQAGMAEAAKHNAIMGGIPH